MPYPPLPNLLFSIIKIQLRKKCNLKSGICRKKFINILCRNPMFLTYRRTQNQLQPHISSGRGPQESRRCKGEFRRTERLAKAGTRFAVYMGEAVSRTGLYIQVPNRKLEGTQ